MNRERIAGKLIRIAKSLTSVLTGGLWAYQVRAWEQVSRDLAKALKAAFGRYAKVSETGSSHNDAWVVMDGYTQSDLSLDVTVHIVGMNNKYILLVTAHRPDWGVGSTQIIKENHSFSDFDPKKIAKRVVQRVL